MNIRENIDKVLQDTNRHPLPDCGLLLVGSNPLPVYAVIMALQPRQVLLVGTEEVQPYLIKLIDMLPSHIDRDHRICDPAQSNKIQDRIREFFKHTSSKDLWFSYTAGTKSMSVNGFEVWKEMIGQNSEHWGIYLSPYGPKIFMNKVDRYFLLTPSSEYYSPEISFQEIIDMHLNTLKDQVCRDDHQNETLADLAQNIHAFVNQEGITQYLRLLPPAYLEKGKVKLDGYEQFLPVTGEMSFLNQKNYRNTSIFMNFDMQPWAEKILSDAPNNINVLDDVVTYFFDPHFPKKNADDKIKPRINTMKWLVGKWLEVWVAKALVSSQLFSEVHDSCILWPPKVPQEREFQFEIDVCAMRGVTPFIFTCTIEHKARGLNKEKLFEVGQRSRQLGGEHARSALICLSYDSKGINELINEGWQGYNTVRVFGIDDISNEQKFIKEINKWVNFLES